nr:putative reverse transcriptase domain-containing protein [Tanacetum cinerariifolium]
MPTKIELTLEQSQQGVSNDVLVSIEGVEELKRNVWIKGENKAALQTLLGAETSEDGNPARANVEQALGRKSYALSWKPCQGDSLNLPDHGYNIYTVKTVHCRCCRLVPAKSDSYTTCSYSSFQSHSKSIDSICDISLFFTTSVGIRARFLIKMFPRRSEDEDSKSPFFEGDGSSSDEWREYGMASDDYEGPLVLDDDQYEKESMPVYDTDIKNVIEEEEGFIGKRGFGGEENNIEDIVVVATNICSSMIQTNLSVDVEEDVNTKSHELILNRFSYLSFILRATSVGDGSSFDEWRDYGMASDDYEGPLIFDDDQFEYELEMGDDAFVLTGKEVALNSKIPEAMFPLLEEFFDVFPDELHDALPPLCDIQHHIDLEHGSQLPNTPHDRMSLGEHEELHRQVGEIELKLGTRFEDRKKEWNWD